MKNFFSGIVKRKAAKGMENIYKDNPRLAKAAKAKLKKQNKNV